MLTAQLTPIVIKDTANLLVCFTVTAAVTGKTASLVPLMTVSLRTLMDGYLMGTISPFLNIPWLECVVYLCFAD